MDRYLRIVGARLNSDIATTATGVEGVAGEPRQIGQRGGSAGADSEPVAALGVGEQRRSESDRQCQPRRGQVERFAGIGRRVVGSRADRAVDERLPALGHPLGHPRPGLQQLDQFGAGIGVHVEYREVQPILRGCDDSGLVIAAERHGVRRCRFRSRDTAGHHTGAGRDDTDSRRPDQTAAGDAAAAAWGA